MFNYFSNEIKVYFEEQKNLRMSRQFHFPPPKEKEKNCCFTYTTFFYPALQ